MSNALRQEKPQDERVDPQLAQFEDEDYVPEDDRIIGKAFRWSMIVILGLAVIIGLGIWIAKRPKAAAPEVKIAAAAPEQVVQSATAPTVDFVNITAQAGITFRHFNGSTGEKLLPETMGGGVAFLDYDQDGDPDLLFVNSTHWPHNPSPSPAPTSALYRNDGGGRFTDVSRETGMNLTLYGMGVAVGDYDADGDPDVFISAVGPNKLLRNDGGVFKDVTAKAGVAGGTADWSTGSGFFDYDKDGDLDLFVCNYVKWTREIDFALDFRLTGVGRAFGPPQNFQGTFPYLYRNEGNGTFTDVTEAAGLHVVNRATGVPLAKSLAIAPIDVDRDSWVDVIVANDTVQKFLFHNRGDGTFEEVGEDFGLAYDRNGNVTGAMGIDAAYYRNDNNLGIMIGNFANEMTSVYVAQDDPRFFVDEAIGEGIGAPSRLLLKFGLILFDYDLDGRLDVLEANGHIESQINAVDPSQSYEQPAQLFWNAGDLGFVEAPIDGTGLAEKIVGRGVAYADIDADGDLDVVLTQIAGPPLLLRNDQKLGNHWLRVKLVGKAPSREAINAWIELTAGGITQKRQVMPTRSYLAQVELPVTFGLGKSTSVDSLKVIWPDGSEQAVAVSAVDQQIVVEQGS